MKIYVLMETATDTAHPTVSVHRRAATAIAIARSDIKANGMVITDEVEPGGSRNVVWECDILDEHGNEFHSEVTEHEIEV